LFAYKRLVLGDAAIASLLSCLASFIVAMAIVVFLFLICLEAMLAAAAILTAQAAISQEGESKASSDCEVRWLGL
jgi:hypothetical protein